MFEDLKKEKHDRCRTKVKDENNNNGLQPKTIFQLKFSFKMTFEVFD